MLGIQDIWVFGAYALCILSALLCVVYGALMWNRGDEPVKQEDMQWAQEEKQENDEIL